MKRLVSLMLCIAIVINGLLPVYADTSYENKFKETEYTEDGYEVFPDLTDAEIEAGIEMALQMQLAEIPDLRERRATENGIRANLELIDTSASNMDVFIIGYNPGPSLSGFGHSQNGLGDIWRSVVPDVKIKNKYVAGTIDALLTGVAIAAGAGTISVALKKYGKDQLERIFFKTLKKRVIGKAAIAVGISLPFLASFLNYVIDPAGKIAEYLDSKDDKPNNGYFDVVW